MSRSENFENGSTIEMQIVRVTGELKIGNDQWQTKGSQNLQWVTRKTTAGGGFWRLGREKGHSSFGVVVCENFPNVMLCLVIPFIALCFNGRSGSMQQLNKERISVFFLRHCEWYKVVQFSPKYRNIGWISRDINFASCFTQEENQTGPFLTTKLKCHT